VTVPGWKIMIAEDDLFLARELQTVLADAGYSVAVLTDFVRPTDEILSYQPDLLILDLNLPGSSGFDICRFLKLRSSFPILILTARDSLADELAALGFGADDYLTKPFDPDRLLARVQRLLETYRLVRGLVRAGPLTLDPETWKLVRGELHLLLTETEGKIIEVLMRKFPETVPQAEIIAHVWGKETYIDDNILPVNLTRLRKTLSSLGWENMVETIRGQGYRLQVTEEQEPWSC
jgi:DNA-binding response OmpR family regulator